MGRDYHKVSDLIKFPEFYPGLGILYVQPKTIPYGPFEAFDRDGTLVATVYMIPIADFDAHRPIAGLPTPPVKVDHVDIYFNSGHPGVEMPHYHIVLWHVSRERAETLQ